MISSDEGIPLQGLDGSNPLAFLAALGTLRTLTCDDQKPEIYWKVYGGKWTPILTVSDANIENLPDIVYRRLPTQLGSPWDAEKRLPFSATRLRDLMLDGLMSNASPELGVLGLLAAFGCEAIRDEKGLFEDTALRMVRSGDSSGQGFLDYACKTAANATCEDIRQCLLDRWEYRDRGSSFRWDPNEDRKYALQANNPSDDGALSVIGANRLALEALPLFATHPVGQGLATTGFIRASPKAEREMRWPIWSIPASLPVVRSLLTFAPVFEREIDPMSLSAVGIQAVFASRQFKPNQYYRNFSPARQL